VLNSLGQVASLSQRKPEVVMGGRGARVESQGLPVVFDALGDLTLLDERIA
jgi:hypothetical protein